KHRAQKTARNITANTTMVIPAHNVPAFKPSKSFVAEIKNK
ncbi:MAG TPA: HU family DNA-binding protein, partial [Candidatus Cryptobacteroides sp.]|nr:HU family DNA-binding protein [Candidatus Cryptobacteroides sp.]